MSSIRTSTAIAIAATSVGFLACPQPPANTDSGGANAQALPRVLLLISIDTLRADRLGAYGNASPTSPRMDALAEEGVLFEDASSTSTWTLPAHASMLTGLYPDGHGLREGDRKLRGGVQTLGSYLSRAGFRTAAVVNSLYLGRYFELNRGFEQFLYVEESTARIAPSTWVTDQALQWIDAAGENPIFLFLHYYDLHSDYNAQPDYLKRFLSEYAGEFDGSTRQLVDVERGRRAISQRDVAHLRERYDASVRQMDDELARLFSGLESRGLWRESSVVLTSDHGEEFFEHGGVLHGRTQYQELLHVPLLIRGPGIPSGLRVDLPVSLIDIAPTVLGLAGVPIPADMPGVDLRALWQEAGADRETFRHRNLFFESTHGLESPVLSAAVRRGASKLHYLPSPRDGRPAGPTALFDLDTDPEEQRDLLAAHPEEARALEDAMRAYLERLGLEAPAEPPGLDADAIEKLKALGYGG